MKNPFYGFTRRDYALWLFSAASVATAFGFGSQRDALTLAASLVGVTALIFVAKGRVVGQILTLAFAALYGAISYRFAYYGEMITYLGMTAPIALAAIIVWCRHPSGVGRAVKVAYMTAKKWLLLALSTLAVTAAFYFILRALETTNLIISTVSVATSFIAASLTLLRSEAYALGYAANDIVLTIMWVLASLKSPEYIPMVACFIVFLLNDMYGFICWRNLKRAQAEPLAPNS